jgi:hypothetical protein
VNDDVNLIYFLYLGKANHNATRIMLTGKINCDYDLQQNFKLIEPNENSVKNGKYNFI